jgi:ECF sigma factor
MGRATDVTSGLEAWSRGDPSALDQLIPIVYEDLRRVAARRLRLERDGHTLSPTALVHETYPSELATLDARQALGRP